MHCEAFVANEWRAGSARCLCLGPRHAGSEGWICADWISSP